MASLTKIKHILLDIEGTILPISFVKDTLFPYATNALPEIAKTKWSDPEFSQYKADFPKEFQASPEALIAHVKDLTERNVKAAYFKNLQGYLWEEGYHSGAYSSPFFQDVMPTLRRWKEQGLEVSIYSSGSVFAQQLLFQHVKTDAGGGDVADLRDLVTQWFDTVNAGSKMEKASYVKIAEELGVDSGEILFLSDNVKELAPAKDAGMVVRLAVREGNDEVSDEDRKTYEAVETIESFLLGVQEDMAVKPSRPNGHSVSNRKEVDKVSTDVLAGGSKRSMPDGGSDGPAQAKKKQKKGYVEAKVHRAPSRRSQRLQNSDKPHR